MEVLRVSGGGLDSVTAPVGVKYAMSRRNEASLCYVWIYLMWLIVMWLLSEKIVIVI